MCERPERVQKAVHEVTIQNMAEDTGQVTRRRYPNRVISARRCELPATNVCAHRALAAQHGLQLPSAELPGQWRDFSVHRQLIHGPDHCIILSKLKEVTRLLVRRMQPGRAGCASTRARRVAENRVATRATIHWQICTQFLNRSTAGVRRLRRATLSPLSGPSTGTVNERGRAGPESSEDKRPTTAAPDLRSFVDSTTRYRLAICLRNLWLH